MGANRRRPRFVPAGQRQEVSGAKTDSPLAVNVVAVVLVSRTKDQASPQLAAGVHERTSQAEAPRDEAVAMLDEWLAAMPQVRGSESRSAALALPIGLGCKALALSVVCSWKKP